MKLDCQSRSDFGLGVLRSFATRRRRVSCRLRQSTWRAPINDPEKSKSCRRISLPSSESNPMRLYLVTSCSGKVPAQLATMKLVRICISAGLVYASLPKCIESRWTWLFAAKHQSNMHTMTCTTSLAGQSVPCMLFCCHLDALRNVSLSADAQCFLQLASCRPLT